MGRDATSPEAGPLHLDNALPQAQMVADVGQVPDASVSAAFGGKIYVSAGTSELGLELHRIDPVSQTVTLLKDICSGAGSSSPSQWAVSGAYLYFVADDCVHGAEVWRTDGTESGTILLKDIRPGAEGGSISALYSLPGVGVVFTANDGTTGVEPWVSNGSEAGTFQLADINPGSSGSFAFSFTPFLLHAGFLYFVAYEPTTGYELWRTDGTSLGTTLVADIAPGAASGWPLLWASLGTRLIFTADVTGSGDYEPWYSEGTAATTAILKDIRGGGLTSSPDAPRVIGSKIVFVARDGAQRQPWVTDGTPVGTVKLSTDVVSASVYFVKGGSYAYYLSGTDIRAANVDTLAASTLVGTNAGALFSDLELGGFTYLIGLFVGDGHELWKINNTTQALTKVKDLNPGTGNGASNIMALDATHFVFSGYSVGEGWEPWISDGSGAGTLLLKDIYPGTSTSYPQFTTADAGKAFFWGRDMDLRPKFFMTDGTLAGTVALSDTMTMRNGGAGFSVGTPPKMIGEIDGKLLFSPYQSGETGIELWTTEGTAASTQLLKDIWVTDLGTSSIAHLYKFGKMGNRWVFNATDDALGQGVWITDGTAIGTTRIAPLASSAFAWVATLSDSLGLFVGNEGTNGSELWVTDGSAGGTQLLVDAQPGATGSQVGAGLVLGGVAIFPLYTVAESWELWKSDGTPGGTGVLKNFVPGATAGLSSALSGAVLGSILVFAANDGTTGTELWATNGTLAGTTQVKDIYPGPMAGTPNSSLPSQFIKMGDKLFFTANDGVNGRELWSTDGTLAGTQLLKDIAPGATDAGINSMAVIGSGSSARLIFNASDAVVGTELWITDGTTAGTSLVKDIRPGSVSALAGMSGFVVIGNYAYFAADDGVHGTELWRTDGTTAGTALYQDLLPGSASSTPAGLTKVGAKLYFAAGTPLNGIEVHVLDPGSL